MTSTKTVKAFAKHPSHDGRGAVVAHWTRCGKPWCRCANGGPPHGPYALQAWREGGRLRRRYVRLADVEAVRAACRARRERQRAERALVAASWGLFRQLRALARGVGTGA